jgi:hypothetical protein
LIVEKYYARLTLDFQTNKKVSFGIDQKRNLLQFVADGADFFGSSERAGIVCRARKGIIRQFHTAA